MKALARWLSLPTAILVALALVAPAAAGGPEALPDAQVRRAGGPQLGDNILSLDGTNQTVGGHQPRSYADGAVRWFYAYGYNDGDASSPCEAGATEPTSVVGTVSSPFLVQYFTPSGVDITLSVLTGTYVSASSVAPGARCAIRVKVTVTPGTPHGAKLHLLVTFRMQSNFYVEDAVGIKMWRK